MEQKRILWMEEVGMDNVAQVGGKNASLGEMIKAVSPHGVKVPSGFIATATAYDYYFEKTGLNKFVKETLDGLDTKNLRDLAKRGALVRKKIQNTQMPKEMEEEIKEAYAEMEKRYGKNVDCAVRSSATAEDLPGASFAGEHETYLGIRGAKDVITAIRWAMASLFTDRAISYRTDKGFDKMHISLSVGVQKMVRSDKGVSGVMFSVDTETGFKNAVVINAVYGLGEMIVQGHVTPDEFIIFKPGLENGSKYPIIHKKIGVKNKKMVYGSGQKGIKQTKVVSVMPKDEAKFTLSDKEAIELARWGMIIEKHYSERSHKWVPMDMEWAKDGETGQMFIVQARPETVQAERDFTKIKEYVSHSHGKDLVKGISVGSAIATGKAKVLFDYKQILKFKKGEVLVTSMTDPDWEPIMKMASAIVTDKGGRTSHAAIVSRELGIPAIVGSGNATKVLKTGMDITVDTSGSEGMVYEGTSKFEIREHDLSKVPTTKTKIMANIASPNIAFENSFLPVAGVGLAREEFIIATHIGLHPLALLNYKKLSAKLRAEIDERTMGWEDPVQFYVDNLAFGIATIGAAFHPRPVIVRFSDFKTNEYRGLIGGDEYEPHEENPMLGWRGASRYYDPKFAEAFGLECDAIRMVREDMGVDNVIPMIPFCRTTDEAKKTLEIMAKHGLVAKSMAKHHEQKTTPVYLMCEIPSNVLLADDFLDLVDGFSIGSNDLTQCTLGLDRDSGIVSHVANENNPAVRNLIATVIKKCNERGKHLGICGQGPSDLPDFAEFLVEHGIESMSLNPDVVIRTMANIAKLEEKLNK